MIESQFRRCPECKVIVDVVLGQLCSCPRVLADGENPLPEHMRELVEPYIRWREREAVRVALSEVADAYLRRADGL